MKMKRGLWQALLARLDIPGEALPGGFGLTLSGQRELTVRGCHRILQYGEEEIVLAVGKTALHVVGRNLLCAAFGHGGITVKGNIASLCFGEVGE